MTVKSLREKYLQFFVSKGHEIFPSGSLIPIDVTGKLDESLLFNGAGMTQFKPYFYGAAKPASARLTTAQKCVRTGDIDEVGDDSHLTFFEMLGNFSFGDYFVSQAITFSWEFLTSPEWLGLDKNRLAFTVFEDDQDAYGEWEAILLGAEVNPATRIFKLGEETNFWPASAVTKGPPGPCGPNSEMFYWVSKDPPPSGNYGNEDFLRDDEAGNWLEIWNDVFIQYDWKGHLKDAARPAAGYQKESMEPLPFRSIDTGMGLERTAVVLGGYQDVYETDAFQLLISTLSGLTKEPYLSSDPVKRAYRIICDHVRTASFCIADGVLPGNSGRGYVLRRLIRRAVLKGFRTLGLDEPFLHKLVGAVVEVQGHYYVELADRKSLIVEILQNEEALFRRTLKDGIGRLTQILERGEGTNKSLSGSEAFKLYDTYGFPLEVTLELAAEAGWVVDTGGYETALLEAQERSRSGQDRKAIYGDIKQGEGETLPATGFYGYDELSGMVTMISATPINDELTLVFDSTPFYAASGGQVSDTGTLRAGGIEALVTNVTKKDGVFYHSVKKSSSGEPFLSLIGEQLEAYVDQDRRLAIQRNHTATHLLHAALRETLGTHVTQAGSFVGPDYLRFDFTHGKSLSTDELAAVERKVNQQALYNIPVTTYVDLPIAEARAMGAMALFGEKYGDKVRMVEIANFSRELCGGTHVRMTGEIGLFKIVSESSASSGVRRIESITGEAAYDWTLEEARRMKEAAALLKSSPKELILAIERQIEAQRELKQKIEKMLLRSTPASTAQTTSIGNVELVTELLDSATADEASKVADGLASASPKRVVVVASTGEGKVSFVSKVGKDALASGAHAGNLVKELAKATGGGGGGGPAFATAGGRDPSKAAEALAMAVPIVAAQVGV